MKYKFESKEEYMMWCQSIVLRLNYASIAMNTFLVKETLKEINNIMWCSEQETLY